jgi:predicted nucleic acid-binding protein
MKAEQRMSLADCMVAAYAVRADAILMHKDPEYESLKGFLRTEELPYKPRG